MQSANIKVICRFRPVNEREKREAATNRLGATIELGNDQAVQVVYQKALRPEVYTFDHVFWRPETTQEEIYDLMGRETIENVLNGYNGTIFAYGQTGSGKSFTMFGPDISSEELSGIIPRSCAHIFEHISQDTEGTEYAIKCSFLEIYKEQLRDLLNPNGDFLKIRETGRSVWVEHLTEKYVTSEQEVLDLLQLGEKFRAVSATNMNDASSRSHTLFILSLHQKSPDGSSKQGTLNLVDLAGSEKVGKTGAGGETLEEAKKINQSLSALGNCINSLTKSKGHVPYRDSKLTHLLRESLGGNCKTTLVIACSPHRYNAEETISTLKFGQRAKTIKNAVFQNKQRSAEELARIIDRLTEELNALKKYAAALEAELVALKGSDFNPRSIKQKIAEEQGKEGKEETADSESDFKENNVQDSLTFIQLQVDYDKLKESTQQLIQQLNEEVALMRTNEAESQKEVADLTRSLATHQAALKKLKQDLDAKTFQYRQEVEKIEYKLKQNQLEAENHEAIVSGYKSQLSELELELKATSKLASSRTKGASQEYTKLEKEYNETLKELENLQQRAKELEEKNHKTGQDWNSLQSQHVELILETTDQKYRIQQLEEELESIQKQHADMTVRLQVKQQEKEKLEKNLATSTAKIAEIETRTSSASEERDRILQLEGELSKVKEDLETSRKTTKEEQQQLQSALKTSESANSQLKERIQSLESSVEKQMNEREVLLKKLEQERSQAVNSNVSALLDQLQTLKESQESEWSDWKEMKSSSKQFESQLETERDLRLKLEAELQALIGEKDRTIKSLTKELDKLRDRHETSLEEERKRVMDAELNAHKINLKVETLTEKLERVSADNKELAEKFHANEDTANLLAKEKRTLLEQLQKANDELEIFKRIKTELEKEHSDTLHHVKGLLEELNDFQQKVPETEKRLNETQLLLQDLEDDVLQKQKDIRQLQTELSELQETHSELQQQEKENSEKAQEEAATAAKEIQSLKEKLNVTTEEKERVEEEVDTMSHEKETLQADINRMIQEKESLEQKLEEKKKRRQVLKKERQEKERLTELTISELEEQLNRTQQKLNEAELENETVHQSLSDVQQQLETSQQKIRTLNNEIETLNDQMGEKNSSLESLEETLSSTKDELESTNTSLAELTDVKKEFESLSQQHKETVTSLTEAEETNSNLQEELVLLRSELEKAKMEGRMHEKRLSQEQSRLQESHESVKELTLQVQELQTSLAEEKSQSELKLKELQKELDRLHSQHDQENSQVEDLHKKLQESEQANETLKDEFTQLKRDVKTLTANKNTHEREIKFKNDRIEQQEAQIERLSTRNNELQLQLDNAERSLMEAEHRFKEEMNLFKEAEALARQREREQKIVAPVMTAKNRKQSVKSFLERVSSKVNNENHNFPKKNELSEPIISGLLSKQGKGMLKKWSKGFYYLTSDTLYTFKDDHTQEPKGAIPLAECSVAKASEITKKQHSFSLTHGKKTIYLMANSEEEMIQWLNKLEELCPEEETF